MNNENALITGKIPRVLEALRQEPRNQDQTGSLLYNRFPEVEFPGWKFLIDIETPLKGISNIFCTSI